MRRFVALLVAVAVSAAAAPLPLAGAVGSSPTAKFTRKVDATCAKATERVGHLPAVTKKNIHHVLATEAGILASLAKRLDAITPPQAKKAKYRSLVAQTRLQSAHLRSALKAAKKGRDAKVKAHLQGAVDAGGRASVAAAALGAERCMADYTPGVG